MDHWKAAVSLPSDRMAKIVRRTLREMGYTFRRDRTYHHFTRFAMVLPIPEAAYTFRFWVERPSRFVVDLYTTRPTHSGVVHFIEIQMIEDMKDVRRFVRGLVRRMPRKPWAFTLGDRFRYGFAVPEFLGARRRWHRMLVDPSERAGRRRDGRATPRRRGGA